jgi:undecaprenyl-diphosphatase
LQFRGVGRILATESGRPGWPLRALSQRRDSPLVPPGRLPAVPFDPVCAMAYYLEAILLGILQGIAEFLPISSDGHLVVFGNWLGRLLGTGESLNPEQNGRLLLLVIVLHLGSLATLVVVYWRDLWALRHNPRLVGCLVLTTLVTAALALPFKKTLESMFDSPSIAALGWLITAGFLLVADRLRTTGQSLAEVTWKHAVCVGLLQALAPVPGISRSGTTITAGLLSGLGREGATKYSFLVAIPAICGAAFLEIVKPLISLARGTPAAQAFPGVELSVAGLLPLLVGAVVSFLVGLVALRWLVAFIVKRGMKWFVIYLVVMALFVLAVEWARIPGLVPAPAVGAN